MQIFIQQFKMQCLCFQETRNLKLHMNIILHQPKILDKIVRNSPQLILINKIFQLITCMLWKGAGVGWGMGGVSCLEQMNLFKWQAQIQEFFREEEEGG